MRQEIGDREILLSAIDIDHGVRSQICQPLTACATGSAFTQRSLLWSVDASYRYMRNGTSACRYSRSKGRAFSAQCQTITCYFDIYAHIGLASCHDSRANAKMRIGAMCVLSCLACQ